MVGKGWLRAGAVAAAVLLAVPAWAACKIGRMLELPVTMSGLQPVVTVGINGQDQRFVADSGAFYSMISPGSAAELHLRLTDAPDEFSIGGIGGRADVRIARVAVTLGKYKMPNTEFLVGGSEFGQTGLLGQNVLGVADAEYDLGGGMIRLLREHDCARANLAYWARPDQSYAVLPIEDFSERPLDAHIVGAVVVNGVRLRALFDTGAATSLLTLTAARRAGIRTDGPGVVAAASAGGLGRRFAKTWIAPVADMKFGDEEIRNTHIRISDIDDADFEMLVGADFFLAHHVFVANGQHKLYMTYSGGQVFNLTTQEPGKAAPPAVSAGGPEPTDAAGYSRRGAVYAARHDNDRALADLDRAVALAPGEPRYLMQRARILFALDKPERATADLDTLVRLHPDDAEGRIVRAWARLEHKDKDGAREDAKAAAAALAPPSDLRLTLADLDEQLEDYPASIAQYDGWIAAHPVDHRRPTALNGRCWVRAIAGRELPAAVADCTAALRLQPRTAAFLDSRALAYLKLGQADRALADYNAALTLYPKMATSLYGRAVIRQRRGDKAAAEADFAAAKAEQADIADEMRRYGVTP